MYNIPLFWQVILASCFTYLVTALGASLVFFFKNINKKILDTLMGFGAGVMVAASFWSLLSPAIILSKELGYIEWLLPAFGFLCGGILIILAEKLFEKSKCFSSVDKTKSISSKRSFLLISSVTLHNIPEGMAVGVAFGALAMGIQGYEISGALLLALAIGLQNFPEGAAVSLPLRREGIKRSKCFFYGQASGMVEPISAILGYFLALIIRSILPFLLAFSAGAMIAVVFTELIPESVKENKNCSLLGALLGFIVMMILDVALG